MYVCACMCDKRCEAHFSQIIIKYILFIMVDCIELIESHGMPHWFWPNSCICSQPRVSINEWVDPSWILVTTFAFVNEYCRSETLKTYVGSSFDHLWRMLLCWIRCVFKYWKNSSLIFCPIYSVMAIHVKNI